MAASRTIGMWSKPPTVLGNSYHAKPEQLPSLRLLTESAATGRVTAGELVCPPSDSVILWMIYVSAMVVRSFCQL